MLSIAEMNKYFIASEIVFFNIFGIFGNLNFIYLTAINNKLQSKSSILQCCLSVFHVICLLGELPNSGSLFMGVQLHRNVCFPTISIYIFSICAQSVLTLMITIDIVIILYFPSFYRTANTYKYISTMLIPPTIYGVIIVTWGFLTMDDEVIPFCNPPLSMTMEIRRIWTLSSVVINTLVLLLFVFLIFVFYLRGKKQKRDSRKIMKRMKMILIIFISTWYIALLAADLLMALGITGELFGFLMSNLVFFVLICYSQSFYTVLWRSLEYRSAFFETWSFVPWVAKFREKYRRGSKTAPTSVYLSTVYSVHGN